MKNLTAAGSIAWIVVLMAVSAHGANPGVTLDGKVSRVGVTQASGSSTSAGADLGNELQLAPEVDAFFAKGGVSAAHVPSAGVPRPAGSPVISPASDFFGFNGLTQRDQRLASGGNQFSVEPPDPALAVGNGYVLQAVNNALVVYHQNGARVTSPIALNRFFGLADEATRDANGVITSYGPFTSDPKCLYDAATKRWFVTILEVDVDPATGNLLNSSSVRIAVSQTSDPSGKYYLYSLDTTASGLPDQPLIGTDANGFFISINSFLFPNFTFNGGQIFALSKQQLEKGTATKVVCFVNLQQAEGPGYTIQPANVPPGGPFESANNGTEYFLSALDFNATIDDRITVWAITNTASLNTATPALSIQNRVINTEVYGQPPDAQQRPGPTPLADQIRSGVFGFTANNPLELIAGNDDRMNQVVFANGKLWGAVNTVVKTENGPSRVGIAYFIVTPSFTGPSLDASVAKQGYIAVNQQNVMYPAIGVNKDGLGVVAFTLVGPDFYPSAAYAKIDAVNGAGAVQLAASGAAPEDGFSGYQPFSDSRTARWGDYHTAASDESGNIWFDVEYIPNAPRTTLANWGTFIGKVRP